MRTTLTLDDDVLQAARAIAHTQNKTLGDVVSDLVRRALEKPATTTRYRDGVPLLPDRPGPLITLEHVNTLRDDLP